MKEEWTSVGLVKMRLLQRASQSFAKSVKSSLKRKRQPSADIARERTSSTGTRSTAPKNVLTQPAQRQQQRQQQQHQQRQQPRQQPQQFLRRVNL